MISIRICGILPSRIRLVNAIELRINTIMEYVTNRYVFICKYDL